MKKGTQLVLICEDIERRRPELLCELAEEISQRDDIKLIVSCRTSALEHTNQQLMLMGRNKAPSVVEAPRIPDEELIWFVKGLMPRRCPEDHIVKQAIKVYDRNPYFLKL